MDGWKGHISLFSLKTVRPANNQVTLKFVLKIFLLLNKLTIDLLFNIFLMTCAY